MKLLFFFCHRELDRNIFVFFSSSFSFSCHRQWSFDEKVNDMHTHIFVVNISEKERENSTTEPRVNVDCIRLHKYLFFVIVASRTRSNEVAMLLLLLSFIVHARAAMRLCCVSQKIVSRLSNAINMIFVWYSDKMKYVMKLLRSIWSILFNVNGCMKKVRAFFFYYYYIYRAKHIRKKFN